MKVRSTYIVVFLGLVIVGCITGFLVVEQRGTKPQPLPRAQAEGPLSSAPQQPGSSVKPFPATPPLSVPETAGTSQIEVEPEQVDMGLISNSSITEQSVTVRNVGTAPLEIPFLSGGCKCIIAKLAQKTIAPGCSTELTLGFDPMEFPGFETKKRALLRTNDPKRPAVQIEVSAKIDPEFALEPAFIKFDDIQKGDTVEESMLLRQTQDEPLELLGLDVGKIPRPWLELSYRLRPEEEWAADGKREYVITAKILPEARAGQLVAPFLIKTNCERLKSGFRTTVLAPVKTFYEVLPRGFVQLSRVSPGQRNAASASVTADRPIDLKDVQVEVAHVEATVHKDEDPKVVLLDFHIAKDAPPGRLKGKVSFNVCSEDRTVPDFVLLFGSVREEGEQASAAGSIPPPTATQPDPQAGVAGSANR